MTSTPTLTAPLTDPAPHLIAHAFAAPSAAAKWLRTTIADGEIGGLVTLPRALRNVSSAAATRLITVDLRRQGYPQAATPSQVCTAWPAAKVAALLEAADVDSGTFTATYGPQWEDIVAFTETVDRQTWQIKKALNSQHYLRPHDSLMAQIRSQVSAFGGHDRLSALANAAAVSTPMGEASTPRNAMLHILVGRVATALSARDLIESSLFEAVVAPWRQVVHFGR